MLDPHAHVDMIQSIINHSMSNERKIELGICDQLTDIREALNAVIDKDEFIAHNDLEAVREAVRLNAWDVVLLFAQAASADLKLLIREVVAGERKRELGISDELANIRNSFNAAKDKNEFIAYNGLRAVKEAVRLNAWDVVLLFSQAASADLKFLIHEIVGKAAGCTVAVNKELNKRSKITPKAAKAIWERDLRQAPQEERNVVIEMVFVTSTLLQRPALATASNFRAMVLSGRLSIAIMLLEDAEQDVKNQMLEEQGQAVLDLAVQKKDWNAAKFVFANLNSRLRQAIKTDRRDAFIALALQNEDPAMALEAIQAITQKSQRSALLAKRAAELFNYAVKIGDTRTAAQILGDCQDFIDTNNAFALAAENEHWGLAAFIFEKLAAPAKAEAVLSYGTPLVVYAIDVKDWVFALNLFRLGNETMRKEFVERKGLELFTQALKQKNGQLAADIFNLADVQVRQLLMVLPQHKVFLDYAGSVSDDRLAANIVDAMASIAAVRGLAVSFAEWACANGKIAELEDYYNGAESGIKLQILSCPAVQKMMDSDLELAQRLWLQLPGEMFKEANTIGYVRFTNWYVTLLYVSCLITKDDPSDSKAVIGNIAKHLPVHEEIKAIIRTNYDAIAHFGLGGDKSYVKECPHEYVREALRAASRCVIDRSSGLNVADIIEVNIKNDGKETDNLARFMHYLGSYMSTRTSSRTRVAGWEDAEPEQNLDAARMAENIADFMRMIKDARGDDLTPQHLTAERAPTNPSRVVAVERLAQGANQGSCL